MCRPASFIVTKDKVFWSKASDSHEEIIAEFDLARLDSDVDNVCLVRTEVVPPNDDFSSPIDTWKFYTDQDIVPKWYDEEDAEKRCRIALASWAKQKIISDNRSVENGNYFAIDNATVKAWGNATVKAWDNATVEAWDNATVEAWGNATVEAWGNATVNIYENYSSGVTIKSVLGRAVVIDRRNETIAVISAAVINVVKFDKEQ